MIFKPKFFCWIVPPEVWRHFQLNGDKTKTRCHHCDSLFAYSGTTATMMRHLKVAHPTELQKSSDESGFCGLEADHFEDDGSIGEFGDDGDVVSKEPLLFEDRRYRYRSEVWFHFQFNEDKTKTSCNYCDSEFSHHGAGTTTTMMRHLQRLHPTELDASKDEGRSGVDEDETIADSEFKEMSDEEDSFSKDEVVAVPSDEDLKFEEYLVGARHRSEVWKHFRVNEDKTKTSCVHCHKVFAFCGGTTSTLMKHLRKHHPSELQTMNNKNELDVDIVKEETITNSGFKGKSEEFEDFEPDGNTGDGYESSEKFVEYRVSQVSGPRSEVWKHFHVNEEKTKAKCLHCHKQFRFSSGTSTLMKHLRKCHPEKLDTESDLYIDKIKEESIAISNLEENSTLSDGSMYDGNDIVHYTYGSVADEVNGAQEKQFKFEEYPLTSGRLPEHRSEAWKHFHVNEDRTVTSCLHCHKLFTFCGGSTSSLLKHLRKCHPAELKSMTNDYKREIKSDHLDDFEDKKDKVSEVTMNDAKDVKLEATADEDEKKSVEQFVNRPDRSEVWKHFHLSEDKTYASCYHCQKHLAFSGSTTTMMRHLNSRHPDELETSIDESASKADHAVVEAAIGFSEDLKFEVRPSGPRYRSVVWQHFHLNEDSTVASCDYCHSLMTYSGGTTATMLKHLQAKHPGKLPEAATDEGSDPKVSSEEDPKSEEPMVGGSGSRSEVWKHFHLSKDNTRVSCEHCKRSFAFCNGSTSTLLKHLRGRHPAELKARRGDNDPPLAEYFRRDQTQ